MKALSAIILMLLLSASLFSQFSENAAFPNLLAGGNGEQVMPKTAITSDGKIYVCRFDNSVSGNYDVYLQLLSQQGVQQWAANGILISSHTSMSWLTDYDLTVDESGNALICFQDIRSAGVNNIILYRVSPEGSILGSPDGIVLSYDTVTDNANYSPKVLNTSDNSCYVAWQRTIGTTSEIDLQRLNANGEKLWGDSGISITSPDGKCNWPQLLESGNGDILMKYYVDSGPYWAPVRHLFVAKLDLQGIVQWTTTISNAGGISAWTQLIGFASDGTGGAILAWHDDRNSDMVVEAYVAHVGADGSISTPDNGALLTTNTGNQQYEPVITVDGLQQRIYVFFKATNADQNQFGICRQLLDFAGNKLWGETGEMMFPLSAYVRMPLYAYRSYYGTIVVYEEGVAPNSDTQMNLKASCFRNSGESPFSAIAITANGTNKMHFDFARHLDGWIALVWEEGLSGNDIYGMRLNRDGSLGMDYPAPLELTATLVSVNEILLNWVAPSISYPPLNYQVFMNGSLAQIVPATQTSLVLSGLDPGAYSFYIIASYPENHESVASNTAEITVVSNSDASIPVVNQQIQVMPNPLSKQAEICYYCKGTSLTQLSLYNLKGQKVEELGVISGKPGWNSINWQRNNQLSTGVYFIRMHNDYGTVVKKLVIQ